MSSLYKASSVAYIDFKNSIFWVLLSKRGKKIVPTNRINTVFVISNLPTDILELSQNIIIHEHFLIFTVVQPCLNWSAKCTTQWIWYLSYILKQRNRITNYVILMNLGCCFTALRSFYNCTSEIGQKQKLFLKSCLFSPRVLYSLYIMELVDVLTYFQNFL